MVDAQPLQGQANLSQLRRQHPFQMSPLEKIFDSIREHNGVCGGTIVSRDDPKNLHIGWVCAACCRNWFVCLSDVRMMPGSPFRALLNTNSGRLRLSAILNMRGRYYLFVDQEVGL